MAGAGQAGSGRSRQRPVPIIHFRRQESVCNKASLPCQQIVKKVALLVSGEMVVRIKMARSWEAAF